MAGKTETTQTSNVRSMSRAKRDAKQTRLLALAVHFLEELKEPYEDYVRAYRLLHDMDPDLDEVSNNWPPSEVYVIEED